MKKNDKPITFNHIRPYYVTELNDGSASKKIYDLGPILKQISRKLKQNEKVEKEVLGEKHRFYRCMYSKTFDIWEMQILHLRESLMPGIADDKNGSYELIKLNDNQYPAESTSVLYNERDKIIYIQANRYGTTLSALQIILEELSPEGTKVILDPIIYRDKIRLVRPDSAYRSVFLEVDSSQLKDDDSFEGKGNSLYETIRSFKKYDGRFIKIELGFSRQRSQLLNAESTSQLVHEAYDFNGTQSLKVRMAQREGDPYALINLLKDRKTYEFKIKYSRQFPITHERIFSACLVEYKKEHDIPNHIKIDFDYPD